MSLYLIIILFISLASLNIFDGYSTWYLMTYHDVQELNPFMNYLMEIMGVGFTVCIVKSFFLLFLLFVWLKYRIDDKTPERRKNFIMFGGLGILNIYYLTFMYLCNYQLMKAVG